MGTMANLGNAQLHWADVSVIVGYFVIVLAVGLWSSKRSTKGSVSGYFLASRNMHWILVGSSLFASNIGSGHFVGLAGSGAASGIGIATFELNGVFVLLLLGWVFVPVYMASGVYTMPEYLQKRFGGQRIRIYLSVLALILYVFTKISADLFAGAIFIKQSLGWNLYFSVILLLSIAAIFTITGGLTAVIWTDFVQTILMLVGSVILMVKSFIAVGGYHQMWQRFLQAVPVNVTQDVRNESCGRVPADALHFFRDPVTSDLPWTGVIFGLTISAIWYWCSDQVIVQRALASKDLSHAKAGTILAGYLKILPLFLLVFPGMISRVLYTDEVGCAVPSECERICGSSVGCTNIAYPLLVLRLMPIGLSGMMLAVMMAALMSSLTSIFNSSSTIFTMDIWTRFRKNATEWELLIVGRLFVVVLVIISILWIPVINASQGSQLFVYIQSITSYLAPPVCAVYVLAILWGRINEKGAFWSLMIGLGIGIIRFVLEFMYSAPPCSSPDTDQRPLLIVKLVGRIHYLHFGIFLFLFCCAVTTIISLCTEPIDAKYLHRLTFWTRRSREVREDIDIPTGDIKPDGQYPMTEVATISNGKTFDSIPASIDGSALPLATEDDHTATSWWRRHFYFICGIEKSDTADVEESAPRLSKEEEAEQAAKFVEERSLWKIFCNINAVVLLAITLAICGYYA